MLQTQTSNQVGDLTIQIRVKCVTYGLQDRRCAWLLVVIMSRKSIAHLISMADAFSLFLHAFVDMCILDA